MPPLSKSDYQPKATQPASNPFSRPESRPVTPSPIQPTTKPFSQPEAVKFHSQQQPTVKPPVTPPTQPAKAQPASKPGSRLESWAFYVLLATLVLAPLSFWSSQYVSLDTVKTFINRARHPRLGSSIRHRCLQGEEAHAASAEHGLARRPHGGFAHRFGIRLRPRLEIRLRPGLRGKLRELHHPAASFPRL
jgi:hypothetical protein